MKNLRIKITLFLNYFVFAILLNSVGTVILQVQRNYGVLESAASILEACKDLSIATASFLIASYATRIGYKRMMLIALGFIALVCLIMPSVGGFAMTKLLFIATGICFALIKVSVYATIGLVVSDKKEHASLMSFIESFFMIGILSGYFLFSAFVDNDNPRSTAWLNVYYLLAGISLTAFVVLLTTSIDESAVKSSGHAARTLVNDFVAMVRLAALPVVLVFIASAFLYVLIEQSIMSWLPTFNSKILQLPTALSIQMGSIFSGSIALGRFVGGIVIRRVSWIYVLIGCLCGAALMVVVTMPLAQHASTAGVTGWSNVPLAALAFPTIGFFIAPIYPVINSAVLSALPPKNHGPMSGLIVIFSALGGTSGSIITGYIFQTYGGKTAFYFALVPISLLVISLPLFSRLQKRAALPAAPARMPAN